MSDFTTQADHPSSDPQRGDLEIEEVWRAAAAAGHDTDVSIEDTPAGDGIDLRCEGCGATSPVEAFVLVEAVPARDSASARPDLAVYQLRCPACGRAGRLIAPVLLVDRFARAGARDPANPYDEVDHHHRRTDKTPEHPLGDDLRFFDEGHPGNLKDQGPLLDAEGDDIREYTGEPVETEDGWVLPRQQPAGPGNIAGTSEFPDPDTPSATEPGAEGHRE